MKIYIPLSIKDQFPQVTQLVNDPAEADVRLLPIDDKFQVTDNEYLQLKDLPHLVVIVTSNIHRRYIPEDLSYDVCYNIRNKKKFAELIDLLNSNEWTVNPSAGVKKKVEKINSIKEASEKLKAE